MQEKQSLILQLAKKAQATRDDYHIAKADSRRTEFPINSYVLAKYRDRPPTKFHLNWRGPMRVIAFKNNTYTVQNLINGKSYDYHVTQLKPFNYDPIETDPADMARKEEQEFLVEEILNHRNLKGTTSRKTLNLKSNGPDTDPKIILGPNGITFATMKK